MGWRVDGDGDVGVGVGEGMRHEVTGGWRESRDYRFYFYFFITKLAFWQSLFFHARFIMSCFLVEVLEMATTFFGYNGMFRSDPSKTFD